MVLRVPENTRVVDVSGDFMLWTEGLPVLEGLYAVLEDGKVDVVQASLRTVDISKEPAEWGSGILYVGYYNKAACNDVCLNDFFEYTQYTGVVEVRPTVFAN